MKFALALLCALIASANAIGWGIYYTPAGPTKYLYTAARRLGMNSRLCLGKFPRGVTFMCRGRMAGPVRMYVNKKLVRIENAYPWTTSATNGWISPTRNLMWNKWNNVRCVSGRRGFATYSVNFYVGGCVPPKRIVKKVSAAAKKRLAAARAAAVLRRKRASEAAKARVRRAAMQAAAAARKRATRLAAAARRRRARMGKPKKRNPLKWRRNCVVIDGRVPTMSWKLPAGWTRESWGGVTYKKGDKFAGVFPPGTAPLPYQFWVPKKSKYVVVLDMTTTHPTEHNDVFLRFNYGRGLNALRRGKMLWLGRGYNKAYHNRNGRMMGAFTKDFDPHNFVTADVLSPSKRYVIVVGARSTQITIHRILLVACNGKNCDYTNPEFYGNLAQCGRK